MANETGTEVGTVFGGQVNVADMKTLAARAQAAAQNTPRGGAPDGSDYMNFSGKRGIYTIGQDKRQIQDDEYWLVNVTSFEEGWVCWKGGQSAASRMANIYNGVPVAQPDLDELGPFDAGRGDGWFQAKAMVVRSLDNDQQGYFKINSVSGVAVLADFIGEFAERAAAGLPCWPVVTFGAEDFESQGFKNSKPVITVIGWLDNEQMEAIADGADVGALLPELANEPAPAPKPSGRRRNRG